MALNQEEVMRNLTDLRIAYAGDQAAQDLRLQNYFPRPYYPGIVEDIPKDEKVSSSGLDALIVIIRRLISHIAYKHRDPSDSEIRQQEQMNPLLRLAMSNFDFANEKVVNTAGYLALKAFYCDRGLQNSDLTFMTLSEHDLMQKTLWKRSPFLLYNPKTLGHVGREEWSWNVTEDLSKIAQTSLIRFTTGDLGETVSATFRSWVNENFEYIRSANHPAVLRVHYTVNQSEPKRFKDLRHIVVDMRSLVQRPDDQTWGLSEKGARLTNYGLIAEVRLSSTSSSSHANAKSQDTVRVYTLDGQVIPIPHSFPATHINDPLGQPGNSYILYYGMCPNTSPISDAVTDTPLMKTMATRDAIDKVIRSGYSAS